MFCCENTRFISNKFAINGIFLEKDEVSVSTGSGQNVVSNIAENSSANSATFKDFPDLLSVWQSKPVEFSP